MYPNEDKLLRTARLRREMLRLRRSLPEFVRRQLETHFGPFTDGRRLGNGSRLRRVEAADRRMAPGYSEAEPLVERLTT